MELADFLKARFDEDEQAARAATPGPWVDQGGYVTDVGPRVQVTDHGTQDGEPEEDNPQGRADSAHIVRHDPARVLAEVEAKRQELALHRPEPGQHPDFCGYDKHQLPCPSLRLLALPFADHPDYDASWKP